MRQRVRVVLLVLPLLGLAAPATAADSVRVSVAAQEDAHGVLAVRFMAVVTGGEKPYAYNWDFDASDGLQVEKVVPDPTWVYPDGSSRHAVLKVTDRAGRTATVGYDVLPAAAGGDTYTASAPVDLNGVHGTADHPIVISGLDIAGADTNAIRVINSSYVRISANFLHGTHGTITDNAVVGHGIYVQNSSHIEIDHNLVTGNVRGVFVGSTPDSARIQDVSIHDNVVIGSKADHGIQARGAIGVRIYNNVLRNNGDITVFERHRITGIIAWDSDDVVLHDNFATGSSSDGLGVASSNEMTAAVPGFACKNVEVYRNSSIANGEQGIWLSVIHGGSAHDNFTYRNWNDAPELGSSGLRLEADVSDFTVYRNRVMDDEVAGIDLQLSQRVTIRDNDVSTPHGTGILVRSQMTSGLAGVPIRAVSVTNNTVVGSGVGIALQGGNGIRVMNNTVYSSLREGIRNDAISKASVIANNIIARSGGQPLVNAATQARVLANTISVDPRFRAPAVGDFALRTGSPAIGSGDPRFTTCRPRANGKPDRGAVCTRA